MVQLNGMFVITDHINFIELEENSVLTETVKHFNAALFPPRDELLILRYFLSV